MTDSRNPRLFYACAFAAFAWICLSTVTLSHAQDFAIELPSPPESESDSAVRAAPKTEAGTIKFSFTGASWRDVITLLAEEADLALHVADLPTGSFTYTDPRTFTHDEAIDRVNLFLLPQGFTLVRNGRLLTVINLSDPRSKNQLDAMAELVTTEQLSGRSDHEVVKCIFRLGEISADDAVTELAALNLMTTPTVLSKTNQLLIIDTVKKLKNVQVILSAFEPAAMENGTVVKNFALQHVEAEDILTVARPHMGLATGEMIGIDVSISSDLQGKNIFVTGVEDRVKLLENLVTALDRPKSSMTTENGENELKSHFVEGGNIETVYNVLLTLLAGKEVRLSMDEEAGSVVALAPPSVQREIAMTVEQLAASGAEFEVIPLKTVDPYFAISLLEEMLDLPDALDDPDDIDPDAPKIDADPGNMRLFVRAKRPQIEQIKKIVEGLDATGAIDGGEETRLLPIRGKQAIEMLQTSARFWKGDNPVLLFQSPSDTQTTPTERVVSADSSRSINPLIAAANLSAQQRWLTPEIRGTDAAIRCQMTPRGLIIQSEDVDALTQFEEHLRTIMGPLDMTPSPPIVFYLSYTKADDALRMLAELLDGGQSASEGESGTLVNGYVSSSSSDSFLGSILASREGTLTMISDSITVVADTRLNRLIAQGTTSDIEQIETYLKIIDKDSSITSIETYGTSQVIELTNSKASEVAVVLREAYAGRVTASTTGTGASRGQSGGSAQQAREAAEAAAKAAAEAKQAASKKGGEKKPAAAQAKSLEPKMTIAVHEPSNSLIVTAPKQLFEEVQKLALAIDQRAEQSVEVLTPSSGALLDPVMQQILMGVEPTGQSRTQSDRGSDRSKGERR